MSYPPPIPEPLTPLAYGNPYDRRGRPGILTAVGILSIVVGCFSFLASLVGAFGAVGFLMMSRIAIPAPMPPTTAPIVTAGGTASVSGGWIVTPEEDGLGAGNSAIVVSVIERRRTLSDERKAQLESLLAHAGKRIFPVPAGGAFTADVIRNNITRHGEIAGVGGSGGSNWFIVGAGRIEVYDNHAVFRPSGSADVVSVSATPDSETTAAQTNVNRAARRGPATMPVNPFMNMNTTATALMLGENVLSALLAVFLVIIGIMVLRDVRSAGRLHWVYIIIKVPLIIVAAVASVWFWQGFMNNMMANMASTMPPGAAPPPMGSTSTAFAGWTIVMAVVSAAYPIGLFCVLISRAVREYYSPVVE